MGRDNLEGQRRFMTLSYVFMFLALFTVVTAVIAYFLSRKVVQSGGAETKALFVEKMQTAKKLLHKVAQLQLLLAVLLLAFSQLH